MSFIQSISTYLPTYYANQSSLLKWAEKVLEKEEDLRKFRFIVKKSGIEGRYSVIPDFSAPEDSILFKDSPNNNQPPTSLRMELFNDRGLDMAFNAAEKCLQDAHIKADSITHLITVSCTGLSAPGMEIDLSHRLNLSPFIERYSINFMGCYAAFHAIKQAHYICKTKTDAKVLVVCCECCTLHFRNTGREDDLLSTALFGDGAAAFLMTGSQLNEVSFELVDHRSQLIYAIEEMSWKVKDDGFEMRLSRDVPSHIGNNINQLYKEISEKNQIKDFNYFAIHPGGKNILDAFQKSIGLSHKDLRHSRQILKNYGNMSSPTILYVMKEIIDEFSSSAASEANVFAAAFGPGLTLETAIFKLKKNR